MIMPLCDCVFVCSIGASIDYSDGYVGCIRALMVNGAMQDLRGKVDSGEVTYGVSSGGWEQLKGCIMSLLPGNSVGCGPLLILHA